MTHEELIAKIDGTGFQYGEDYVWKIDGVELKKGTNALRAVVELHKPKGELDWAECDLCDVSYPCLTIQAIEKELS